MTAKNESSRALASSKRRRRCSSKSWRLGRLVSASWVASKLRRLISSVFSHSQATANALARIGAETLAVLQLGLVAEHADREQGRVVLAVDHRDGSVGPDLLPEPVAQVLFVLERVALAGEQLREFLFVAFQCGRDAHKRALVKAPFAGRGGVAE